MLAVDFFFRSLRQIGVEYVFGVPGHAIMPIYNELYGRNDVKPILTAHEGGASYMAMHYGHESNTLGVCVATTGPGSTNLLTGVATAYAEGLPLLAITGQCHQDATGLRAYQESTGFGRTIDTAALYKPITKASGLMQSGPHLARTLASWLPLARSGRPGPVHISVPINVWSEDVPDGEAERLLALTAQAPYRPAPSPGVMGALAAQINRARQPLLLLGRGVANARAGEQALAFAARFGLPVVTTTRGRGAIPNSAPLNLGQIGMTSNPHTLQWLASAGVDLVIAVGTSLSAPSLGPALPAMRQIPQVIAVNLDETECRSVLPPDRIIHADAGEFFEAGLSQHLALRSSVRAAPELPARHDVTDTAEPRPGFLHPLQVIRIINDLTPPGSLIIPDAGSHWVWSMRYLFNQTPNGVLTGRAMGGMGQGIAGAVGAALADRDRRVVCVTGDGCFLMHGMELAVAAQHAPNAVFVLFNDQSLNRVYHAQKKDFSGKVISSTFPDYHFRDVGCALGVKAVRVRNAGEFSQAYRSAMQGEQAVLIECMIDQDAGLPQ
jgi:acetolactate synthase I/II/III large subunit